MGRENHTMIFNTGESLSVFIGNDTENSNSTFKINLMLPGYPVFWNNPLFKCRVENFNCDSAYFITEIFEISPGLFKLEIIDTKIDENSERCFLAGRFKFYVKEGDTLDFQYYNDDEYRVSAKLSHIENNKITLTLDKEIVIPTPFKKNEQNNRFFNLKQSFLY